MSKDMRTFGYLCPKCGKMVMGTRSVFALAAADAEIACECGESVLHTRYDGQHYIVTVPCGICGETHTATCPPERVLEGATALGCADTKQFCCYIGDEGVVEKNLRELSILVQKEQQQKDSEEQEAFLDNVIMYEVLSELKDNGMTIRRSAVDLECKGCGAKLRINAATDRDLDDLCCHMKLVIPGT